MIKIVVKILPTLARKASSPASVKADIILLMGEDDAEVAFAKLRGRCVSSASQLRAAQAKLEPTVRAATGKAHGRGPLGTKDYNIDEELHTVADQVIEARKLSISNGGAKVARGASKEASKSESQKDAGDNKGASTPSRTELAVKESSKEALELVYMMRFALRRKPLRRFSIYVRPFSPPSPPHQPACDHVSCSFVNYDTLLLVHRRSSWATTSRAKCTRPRAVARI